MIDIGITIIEIILAINVHRLITKTIVILEILISIPRGTGNSIP